MAISLPVSSQASIASVVTAARSEPGDAACHYLNTRQMTGDFVEAAVRSGHRDEALSLVRELEPLARRPPSPWFGLQMLYARLYSGLPTTRPSPPSRRR